jgi:hypothetical protein
VEIASLRSARNDDRVLKTLRFVMTRGMNYLIALREMLKHTVKEYLF